MRRIGIGIATTALVALSAAASGQHRGAHAPAQPDAQRGATPARWMEYQLSISSDDRYRVDVTSLRRDGDIGFVTDDVAFSEAQELSDGHTFSIKGEHLMIGCDDQSFAVVRATVGGGDLTDPIYIAPQSPAVTRVQPSSYVAKLAVLACDPPPLAAEGWLSLEPGLQVLPSPSKYAPQGATRVWTRTGKYSRSGQLARREYALERWDLYCTRQMGDPGAQMHSGHIAVGYTRFLAIAGEDDLGQVSAQGGRDTVSLSDKARAMLWVRFCGQGI